jgi:hypothetical protein
LSSEKFFIGFLAALVHQGEKGISTANDEHHARFDAVVNWMRKALNNGHAGALQASVLFFATPISGRYSALDSGLFRVTSLWSTTRTEVYPYLTIPLSPASIPRGGCHSLCLFPCAEGVGQTTSGSRRLTASVPRPID